MSILVLVFVAPVKHPNKRNIREKGHILTHSSRIQSILAGKSTWQEPEEVVHIMPMTQRQRKITPVFSMLLYLSSLGSQSGNGLFIVGGTSQLSQSDIILHHGSGDSRLPQTNN